MNINYSYARNTEIEVRVDMERPESQIQYRLTMLHDEIGQKWNGSPFQRADVKDEVDALMLIDAWLD